MLDQTRLVSLASLLGYQLVPNSPFCVIYWHYSEFWIRKSLISNPVSLHCRTLVGILKHIIRESSLRLYCMDSTEENWTCRGQNGRTRFTPLAYQFLENRRYRLGKALTNQLLFEQVGLKGETMNLISANSVTSVDWTKGSLLAQKQQPLAWHKVYIFENKFSYNMKAILWMYVFNLYLLGILRCTWGRRTACFRHGKHGKGRSMGQRRKPRKILDTICCW